MTYVFGVLAAIANGCKNSDLSHPELKGLVRMALVGMADAASRGQHKEAANYHREAFNVCPDLVALLDIEHGSAKARKIYSKAYGLPHP